MRILDVIRCAVILTLAPLAWAQTPPITNNTPPIPTPALPQQSFAPLVKRVLPAVVNISVTESAKADPMADQLPEQFRNSPFDQMLRRFFDQQSSVCSAQSGFSSP